MSHPGPPRAATAVFARVRAALFPSVLDGALNLLAIAALAWLLPPIIHWAILDATFGEGTMQGCPPTGGACWSFIVAKHRLILFGRYPYDEQWRPLIATALLLAVTALALWPRCWGRWLKWVIAATLAAYLVLMSGGVLGLRHFETSYWGGLPLTVLLSVLSIFFGFVVSLPVALGRRSRLPVVRLACTLYIELVRGVPLLSVLFVVSVVLPLFVPPGLEINDLVRVLLGLVFFTAAYMAEVVRGGLQAIPDGQVEAAHALGLGYWRTMRLVVLPQALELVVPAMTNLFIGTFKGTSLVVIIAMMDLLGSAQAALADPRWVGFYVEAYVFAGAIYVVFCSLISWYGRWVERQMARSRSRA